MSTRKQRKRRAKKNDIVDMLSNGVIKAFKEAWRQVEKQREKPNDTETVLRKCPICRGKIIKKTTYHKIPDPFGRIPGRDMGWKAHVKIVCNRCFALFEQ